MPPFHALMLDCVRAFAVVRLPRMPPASVVVASGAVWRSSGQPRMPMNREEVIEVTRKQTIYIPRTNFYFQRQKER